MKRPLLIGSLSLLLMTTGVGEAFASTDELRREKQEVIERKNELNTERENVEQRLNEKERSLNDRVTELKALEEERAEVEEEMRVVEAEYVKIADERDRLNGRIMEEQEKYDERDAFMRERLRSIQKNEWQFDLFYYIMESGGLVDLIGRIDGVKTLYDADRDQLLRVAQQRERLVDLKREEQEKLDELSELQSILSTQRDYLAKQRERQEAIVEAIRKEKESLTDQQLSLALEIEQQVSRERSIEEQIQELARRQAPEAAGVIRRDGESSGSTAAGGSGSAPANVTLKCSDSFDEATFTNRLSRAGVLSNAGPTIIQLSNEYGIDPVLFAAILIQETGDGTSYAIREYNNPGGLMDPATNWSDLQRFGSLEAGLRSTAHTIDNLMNKGGLSTVERLGSAYAPIGAANDPTGLNRHWVPNVKQFMNELGGAACS